MSTATRIAATPENTRALSRRDDFAAPLAQIGFFEQQTPVPTRGRPIGRRHVVDSTRHAGLPGLFRRKRPEPDATPPPEDPVKGESFVAVVRELCTRTDATLIERMTATFGDKLELEQSQDRRFHRLLFKDLKVAAGDDKLRRLDFSGVNANVELRFENCEFDVLDLSYATLHSVRLHGCRPHAASPLKDYGMRILADGLQLAGDFYIERGMRESHVLTLQGHGMRARDVQLVGGTKFGGGTLAREIWQSLLTRLKTERFGDEKVIDQYAVAARACLKTIDLVGLRAETAINSVDAVGIVDIHDARIDIKLLVEAVDSAHYRPVDFVRLTEELAKGGWFDSGEVREARAKLMETARELSGRLSPCLDLGGVQCEGEIRFDGPEPPKREQTRDPWGDEKAPEPAVHGHVNLANAHCRIFTDDGSWLDHNANWRSKRHSKKEFSLTFGLSCFEYDFFGQSPRYLFDDDRQSQHWRARLYQSRTTAIEAPLERELERQQELDRSAYVPNSIKIVRVGPDFAERKIKWLEAGIDKDGASAGQLSGGSHAGSRFDAQPWTHCASVLRHAGFRVEAEKVLLGREKKIREPQKKAGAWAFLVASFFILIFWIRVFAEPLVNNWVEVFVLFVFTWALVWFGWRSKYFDAVLYELLLTTIGFGYEPGKAVFHSLAAIFVGAFIFSCAYDAHLLMKNPSAAKEGTSSVRPSLGAQPKAPGQTPILNRTLSIGNGEELLEIATNDEATSHPIGAAALQFVSGRDYRDCEGYDKVDCLRHPMTRAVRDKSSDLPQKTQSPEPTMSRTPSKTNLPSLEGAQADDKHLDQKKGQGTAASTEQTPNANGPYPRFNAIMYSVDVFIPLMDLSQGVYWVPGRDGDAQGTSAVGGLSGAVRDPLLLVTWVFYWFLIAAGWWYTSVLVATLTGFLDRKE